MWYSVPMFEGLFSKKPQVSSGEDFPKMSEEQRAEALAQIEALKQGGDIKLTPEEEAVRAETERLRNLRDAA